jgi:hypothetical protein
MSYDPYQPPMQQNNLGGKMLEPHRGALILIFGLIGLLACQPFSIAAWLMGGADMQKIRAGQMDPAGEGLTQVGYILGIIGSILFALSIVITIGALIFIFVIAAASAAAH